jgi:hypothetical protein
MQNRVNYIQIVRAAYGNQAIRNAVKNFIPDENVRKSAYQQVIEAIVSEAEGSKGLSPQEKIAFAAEATIADAKIDAYAKTYDNQDILTDAALKDKTAQTWIQTRPLFGENGHFLGTEIHGKIGGKPVVFEKYNANGKLIQSIDPDALLSEWEASHGEWAGRSILDNALRHERVHVQQFTKVQGELKTMDMLGDWELEAYQTEMDGLLKDLDEDC